MYCSLCVVQISPGVGDGKDKKWEKVLGACQEQAVPMEYRSLHKKVKVFMGWFSNIARIANAVQVIEVASVIELSEASGRVAAGLFTLRPLIL